MDLSRFSKKAFFASALIFALFAFSSCQDVIFANIRKEVSLKSSTVKGVSRSIIRVSSGGKEYLYITNGGAIFRKLNQDGSHSYGGWEEVCTSKDIDGNDHNYIAALAADSSNIYAFVASWEENDDKGQNRINSRAIYARGADDDKKWTKVWDIHTVPTNTGDDNPALYLFCTNTIKSENRSAYFNSDGTGYKLNGTNEPTEEADAKNAASCAFINGEVKFAPNSGTYYGSASCTNETASGGDATVLYYSSGSTLHWDGAVKGSRDAEARILSLAVTSDYILVGTASGIKHFHLNNGGSVGGEDKSFETNADAVMSSGYEVISLLVINPEKKEWVKDPEKKLEEETAIYAATDFSGRYEQFDHACLWAYYPERGHWNRD